MMHKQQASGFEMYTAYVLQVINSVVSSCC